SLLHRRISKRCRLHRDDPRSDLPGSGEAPPGGGGGFAPDPARGACRRQDLWRNSEVTDLWGGQKALLRRAHHFSQSRFDGGHAFRFAHPTKLTDVKTPDQAVFDVKDMPDGLVG